MKRRTRTLLQQYYEAPKAVHKKAFLREQEPGRVGMGRMIQTQLHYISKKTWLAATLLFLTVLILQLTLQAEWIGSVYALIPFIVMVSLTESLRSYRYGMQELEMSARFSLKSVVLTRMLIFGIVDIAGLFLIAMITDNGFMAEMIYLMVPFLATAWGGLIIVRHFAGTDGTYYCFVFSALVSALEIVTSVQYRFFYAQNMLWIWCLAGIGLIAAVAGECMRTIRMMEDLTWN